MAKQPPFQDKRFPHQLPYTPGPPPKDYENEQSGLPSSYPTSSGLSQYVQHPHYPIAVAGPSQWAHSSMPGQAESSSAHAGATSSRQSTQAQGAVIAIPPRGNAPRHDTNPFEAGVILEEKRQRNTAASARFRARKKERNQQLEQTLSDLSTRAEELEREASDLRRENTWLKEIVIMKGRQNMDVMSASSGTSSRRGDATSSSMASTSKQKTPESLNVNEGADDDDDDSYHGSGSE